MTAGWLAPVTVSGVSPQRPDADVPPGLLLVDKPGGMTSHDVVARARRVLSVRKVGHAGTLDPMATGLLILGVGAATRLLGYVGGHDKTYEATIRLGQTTVTDDREGEVLTTASAAAPGRRRDPHRAGRADRPAAAGALVGERGEGRRPPLLRPRAGRRGRRAGARGRSPCTASRCTGSTRPTPDLVDVDVTVVCTAGTYIRAIARDAGAALGVGGHLTALRRTSSGPVLASAQARARRGGRGGAARRRRERVPRRSTDAATTVFPAARAHRRGGPRARLRPADPGHRRRPGRTPPSTPTAGWSPSSRTPARPPGSPSASRR